MPEPEAIEPDPTCVPNKQQVVEVGILDLLTNDQDQRPWATSDLIREFGDQLTVSDAISNLRRVGLIHCHGEVVFPSRAAVRFAEFKW